MRLETLYSVPVTTWGLAATQITESWQLSIWLIAGVMIGAGAAVIFPSADGVNSWRKFWGSVLGAIGMSMAVIVFSGIETTSDKVLTVSIGAGSLAWLAFPIVQRGGIKRLRAWIGGKRDG